MAQQWVQSVPHPLEPSLNVPVSTRELLVMVPQGARVPVLAAPAGPQRQKCHLIICLHLTHDPVLLSGLLLAEYLL